uniref:Uncharacterized protein n=1 Tax=Rhizophora mucronata TaxID=61149 RepID=A0A2P2R0B4_RHIMU
MIFVVDLLAAMNLSSLRGPGQLGRVSPDL